ncbi:MAG: hypothetical protein ACXAC8_08645 [Candidatus Hodarchaeales archaeon]
MAKGKNRSQSDHDVSKGLIVTVFKDEGPMNIYNSSPLSEDEAFNMAIKTLTAIGSDVPLEQGEIRAHGPLPTPREPLLTLGYLITLKSKFTRDSRIAQHGRIVVFWIITQSTTAIKYIGVFKRLIRRNLQLYNIKTDQDLNKQDILQKIDNKLQIIETGIDFFYVSENKKVEPLSHLSMVPNDAIIVMIDHSNRQIKGLLREKLTPSKKIEMLQLMNNYKLKLPKATMFKVELVTNLNEVQFFLTKSGIMQRQDFTIPFRFRTADTTLTFEELDDFFISQMRKSRQQLTAQIIKSIQEKKNQTLRELSNQIGFSPEYIEKLLDSAISAGLIKNLEIRDGYLLFN